MVNRIAIPAVIVCVFAQHAQAAQKQPKTAPLAATQTSNSISNFGSDPMAFLIRDTGGTLWGAHSERALPISVLSTGTDHDRTAAVNTLTRYGTKVVPALKAARASATENGKWWIDSILQSLEDQASTSTTHDIQNIPEVK